MNNLIVYSIETASSLALFYSAYWLFLRKETFFKLNRFYLLFSVLISLLMPMLNISIATSSGETSFMARYLILPIERCEQGIVGNSGHEDGSLRKRQIVYDHQTDLADAASSNSAKTPGTPSALAQAGPLIAADGSNADSEKSWLSIVLVIYFIGVALFLARFIANFVWIFGYVLRYKPQQILGINVIRLEKRISPFSFLSFIFVGNKEYPEAELSKIISHEKVHIRQRHTVDLILIELLLVFQWFNPFIWFYKRAIKLTHEYLADLGTLHSGVDLPGYQYSLLNEVLGENNFEMASNYNLSVKKRISMMLKKRSSKLSVLKLTLVLPILVVVLSAFGFDPKASEEAESYHYNWKNRPAFGDTLVKKAEVPVAYLKLIEGNYISTNETNQLRKIRFTEVLGSLYGNDHGYRYKLVPIADNKFINPDDGASFVFDTKDKNTISLLLFGRINLRKTKASEEAEGFPKRSVAFTLANTIAKDGTAAALSRFKTLRDSGNYDLNEDEMNRVGYDLLQSGKVKESVAIFKLNTESFPNSYNVYDSYAEALMTLGDKAQAIENYKRSIIMNPGNASGLAKLKEMGVNTDTMFKTVKVPTEYLKLLEGSYLSTDQATATRWIRFTEENGVLFGNDNGYRYRLIPVGDGKFINPDDGAALVFDTKDKNAITLLLFGTIHLKKIKLSNVPHIDLKNYAGIYIPAKGDTVLKSMEILYSSNKLFRYIDAEPTANRTIELQLVTDNIFFYADRSGRSLEFTVNGKGEVTGCVVSRPDGHYKLLKQK